MILFKKAEDLRIWLRKQKSAHRRIGFVPTMGALHEGHIELIRASKRVSDITVCSIFVNPAQFNDPNDYAKYPVSLENDIEMLSAAETDVLFLPDVLEIYPNGQTGLETYELGSLENILEGKFRPGHFQGVCNVMSRLLNIVRPDDLFMGQKDFQQCLVVKKLLQLMDIPLDFHSVPTIREADGLAKSSRNRRLNAEQRQDAVAISKALLAIRNNAPSEDFNSLKDQAQRTLDRAHFNTDYIEIAGADNLQPLTEWNENVKAVALIAAFQGEVRLIDNMLLN